MTDFEQMLSKSDATDSTEGWFYGSLFRLRFHDRGIAIRIAEAAA